MSDKDGGTAFPVVFENSHSQYGMSLRDYFAAKCIQGMLADPNIRDMDEFAKHAPKQAYDIADAMLKHRSSGDGGDAK